MIMFGFFHRKQPADSNDGVSLQMLDKLLFNGRQKACRPRF